MSKPSLLLFFAFLLLLSFSCASVCFDECKKNCIVSFQPSYLQGCITNCGCTCDPECNHSVRNLLFASKASSSLQAEHQYTQLNADQTPASSPDAFHQRIQSAKFPSLEPEALVPQAIPVKTPVVSKRKQSYVR